MIGVGLYSSERMVLICSASKTRVGMWFSFVLSPSTVHVVQSSVAKTSSGIDSKYSSICWF